MCGIAGFISNPKRSEDEVRAILTVLERALAHRGPDDLGMHVEPGRGFLNRRLSIIDIAGGHQPVYSDDGRIGIVYNGEVYNFQELRQELQARGHRFRTQSDTEVILRMYEEHGVDAFARLEGMFAFCIWDDRKDVIYLVRDAFGMKPLYLYRDNEQLLFSSELTPLLAVVGNRCQLNPQGVYEYLTFRYLNAPLTLFDRITKLPAGSYLRITPGGTSTWNFSDLADIEGEPMRDPAEARARLHDLLLDSVRRHLVGEVPVGLFLSGGVDSSIIATLLKELNVRLEAFNIGFPSVNEFPFSKAVADHSGLTLHNVEVTAPDIIGRMDEMIRALDEPIADPACFPLYLLCEHIVGFAKIVLSGEGGDELFGGYPQYQIFREPQGEEALFSRFHERSWYFLDSAPLMANSVRPSSWRRFRKYFSGPSALAAMSTYDLKTWMPDNLMMKADKILMRHSLEGRFPYLNREMWRLARSLPDGLKISPEGISKSILKRAFADRLPDVVLNRPKMGFTVPVAEILRSGREEVMDLLSTTRRLAIGDVLAMERVHELFGRFYKGDDGLAMRCWTLFVLLRWYHLASTDSLVSAATTAR